MLNANIHAEDLWAGATCTKCTVAYIPNEHFLNKEPNKFNFLNALFFPLRKWFLNYFVVKNRIEVLLVWEDKD